MVILILSTGCSRINNSSLSGSNNGENANSGQKDPFPSDTTAIRFPSVKPNIILILADDLGYEVPTVDGGSSYYTPNIDKRRNKVCTLRRPGLHRFAHHPGLCHLQVNTISEIIQNGVL